MKTPDFYNGIGKSIIDTNGYADIIGIDFTNEVGIAESQVKQEEDTDSIVNEKSYAVKTPSGDVYFLSWSSGKIWKRTYAGVYSLIHTNSNTEGHRGGRYYNGYLYYATANKLGRYNLSSSWTDSFATFGIRDGYRKPMCEQNLKLYIGDGQYVASVNTSGTFTANALDLAPQQNITAVRPFGNDIIVGTVAGDEYDYANQSGIFRWDTYSDSWTYEDYIDEGGVNTFIPADNFVYAHCGNNGNLYGYTGAELQIQRQIKNYPVVNYHENQYGEFKAENWRGKPLVVVGSRVYSFAKKDADFPTVLTCEFVCSQGDDAIIDSVVVVNDTVILTWTNGSEHGVDTTTLNKADGVIETAQYKGSASDITVPYAEIPSGTSIKIETKVDGGDWVEQTSIVDSINKIVYFDGGLGDVNFVQARITLLSNGTDTPKIYPIDING